MSYGFLVKNTVGEVLLDENYNCVQFLGKIPLSLSYSGGVSGSTLYEYVYTGSIPTPAASTGVLYFVTLPSSSNEVWYETGQPYTAGFNNTSTYLTVRTLPGTSYTIPEIYAFTTNNHNASPAGTYGIQLRNSANQVTFDSRNIPLAIASLGPMVTYGSSPTATTISDLPEVTNSGITLKPAFLIPYYFKSRSIRYQGEYEYRGVARRDGSTIYGYEAVTLFDGLDTGTIWTDTYGLATVQMPYINGTLYDDNPPVANV